MIYLYDTLNNPTRLYIKQCPHCGLKYFGKTTLENIEEYNGSGVYWTRHLNTHNVEPIHLWNSDWYYDTSIIRFATKFSTINKIVESKEWANLIDENGIGGFSSRSARSLANKRVNDGTHPFVGGEITKRTQSRRLEDRTHHFLGGEIQRKQVAEGKNVFVGGEIQHKTNTRRLEDRTHHFLGGEIQRQRVKDGTHNFTSDFAKTHNIERVKNGTHNLVGSVTCIDKNGSVVQVAKQIYHDQKKTSKDSSTWNYVSVASNEGKRRKQK